MICRSIPREETEFHTLSDKASVAVDLYSNDAEHTLVTDPEQQVAPCNLLVSDLLAIRRNAVKARKYLREDKEIDPACLQITGLLTSNADKILVSLGIVSEGITSETETDADIDTKCRQLAWLYGRQLSLLELLKEAEQEGQHSHGSRNTIRDRPED
jgi:hypothetical protein